MDFGRGMRKASPTDPHRLKPVLLEPYSLVLLGGFAYNQTAFLKNVFGLGVQNK